MVKLCKENRFIAVRGNLVGDKSMTQMATILNKNNLKVGAISLSNAEQYFDFTTAFRRNMSGFSYLDKGIIVRTNRENKYNRYEYYLQSSTDFLAWLKIDSAKDVQALLKTKKDINKKRVYQLSGPPQPADKSEEKK